MNALRVLGSAFRGLWDRAAVAPDDQLRASIERLMKVSDTIIAEDRDMRAQASDDVASDR